MDRGAWQAIVHGVAQAEHVWSDLAPTQGTVLSKLPDWIYLYRYRYIWYIDIYIYISIYTFICIICVLNCLALRFRRHLEPRDWQISNRMRVYVYTCLILWETLKNVKTAGKNWMWTVRKRGNVIFHPVSQSVSGCFLFFLISVFFFFNLFSYTRSYLQHVGSSSLTTDGIPASCTGNTDS